MFHYDEDEEAETWIRRRTTDHLDTFLKTKLPTYDPLETIVLRIRSEVWEQTDEGEYKLTKEDLVEFIAKLSLEEIARKESEAQLNARAEELKKTSAAQKTAPQLVTRMRERDEDEGWN